MLENVNQGFLAFLKPGPALFLPILIMIAVGILKLFKKDSITWLQGLSSAITLSVAFLAIGLVIGFIIETINPAFVSLQRIFGFRTTDLGWTVIAAISFAWPYAIILFPVQIIINIIMLVFRWTKTLNADLWNVWNKIFTSLLVAFFVGNGAVGIVLGIVAGGMQVVYELKNADLLYERTYRVSRIEGIVSPHSMFLLSPLVHFMDKGLKRIKWFQDDLQANIQVVAPKKTTFLQKLLRTVRENLFIGFLLGLLIMLITIWFDLDNWDIYVLLPFKLAAALVLFPLTAQFFTKSLAPIGSGIQNMLQSKFKKRALYIGLDWPFLAGRQEMWIVASALVPLTLLYSFVFSFVGVDIFPLASIINLVLVPVLLVICNANLKRMLAIGLVLQIAFLYFGTWAAPAVTDLASNIPSLGDNVQEILRNNLQVSQTNFEAPFFRYGIVNFFALLSTRVDAFSISGFVIFIGWNVLFGFYWKDTVKLNAELYKARTKKETKKIIPEMKPLKELPKSFA